MPPHPRASSPDPDLAAAIEAGWRQPVPSLSLEDAAPAIVPLIEVIGEEATQLLCERLGGLKFQVGDGPARVLVEAIGMEAAVKLRDYWGKGHLFVPRRALSAVGRRRRVLEMARAGEPRWKIARAVGVSERQVYHILASAQEPAGTA